MNNYKSSCDKSSTTWQLEVQYNYKSTNQIDVDQITFDKIYFLLQESNYKELISNLKKMRRFCTNSMISQFPLKYDFIIFLSDCISVNDPIDVMLETLKLLKKLFIQPLFIDYFYNSISGEALLSQISSLLTQYQNFEIYTLVLENFINFSGGTIQERDISLKYMTIDTLFSILKSEEIDPLIKYYASRIIHNYCRQDIDLQIGIQIMVEINEIWHTNISDDVKIELNWSINHLGSSLKIDWIKTIKKYQMFDNFFEGLVYDNPNLTIISLYIIFQIIEDWNEPLKIDFNYIQSLLSDLDNKDNISIGCFCVRHLIKLDQSKALLAKDLIDFGIFDQILNIYQNGPFECKMDAMFAFCAFAESDLTERFDIFFENNFISLFLEFFMGLADFDLKIEMVNALILIFEKAKRRNLLDNVKSEFLENDGQDIFEDLKDDENDVDGELATKIDIFLSDFIDE